MNNIAIFTSENCPNCAEMKAYLDSKNLSYEVYNITVMKDRKRELMANGFLSVPVVLIDGVYYLGTEKEKIEEALKTK